MTQNVRRWELFALGGLLALTCGLMVYLAWRTGVTVDEPGHLVGAHMYWRGTDRLAPGDMPPLIKLTGGWVLRKDSLTLPADLGKPGDTRREWEVALAMMGKLPPDQIQRVFFQSRLPLLIFPLLSTLLVWWWARELYSAFTALVAAALFALEPTALAHGAIFKNDHAAAFAYLLFWFSIWRYWRQPSTSRAAWIGVAVALCMTAKLSLLFLYGVAPLLIVAGAWLHDRRRPGWRTIATALGVCLLAYALVLAAAQFDIHRLSEQELDRIAADSTIPDWFTRAAEVFSIVPVPTQMWSGTLSLMAGLGYEMPVYFLGRIWPHGHPLYFPVALLVKAPVTLIALGLVGMMLLAIAFFRRRLQWIDLLWMVPGPLYIFLASRVPLQLGVRLVLPALPFAILLSAYVLERLRQQRTGSMLMWAALALFAFETVRIYPFGIAFFNIAAGGPGAGFRYLADSNLDWGQGLGEVERWMRDNHAAPIRLSYFGPDNMFRYFRGYEVESVPPPWTDALAKGKTTLEPEPGFYYAISPTVLPGQFFAPRYRDYYAAFRSMKPVATPGYSMFVYRVEAPGH